MSISGEEISKLYIWEQKKQIIVNVGGILVKSPMKVESLFHIRVEKSDLVEKNQISLDLGLQNLDKSEKSEQLGTLV